MLMTVVDFVAGSIFGALFYHFTIKRDNRNDQFKEWDQ